MKVNYTEPFNFKPIPCITPLDNYWQNGTWKFNMSEITAGAASQPSYIDIILKGNTALTLVNSKADGLNYLKLFGGTEQLAETYIDSVTLEGKCEQSGTPTPTVPVDVVCNNGAIKYGYTSKNLNVGELDNKGYTSTGGTSTSTTFCGTLWKIKVSEGEKYTVSYGNFSDGISGVFVNTWKTDGTWNLRQAISISSAYTYTIPAGIGEVNFTLYKTGGITIDSNSWIQVEKGETATDYVPAGYGLHTEGTTETVTDSNGLTATAQMLLSVGDYKDTQEVLTGAVTRNIGIKVFDGSENVTTDTYGGYRRFVVQDSVGSYSETQEVMCSHYIFRPTGSREQPNSVYLASSGKFAIYISADQTFTTVAEFSTWLAEQYANGTPVIIVYPLATATTETVTPQILQKAPVTVTGSLTGLVANVVSSTHTTPTPTQPLPINCNNGVVKYGQYGKNLFDKNTALLGDISTNGNYVSRTHRVVSDYIPVRFGQTFVGSGTLLDTDGVDYSANVIKAFYKADKSYINGSRGPVTDNKFTINDETCAYIRIVFSNTSLVAAKTVSIENSVLQLEEGETSTPYEPYHFGIHTDGTVETVGIYGNNIFNKNDTANIGNWYSGSNQTITQANANETLVMRAKPNTTYYFKHCSVKGGCRAFYTEVEDWEIGSPCSNMSGNAGANANVVYSITTSANAKWIFFNYGRNNVEASFDDQRNDFMVSTSELTSDTPYEPYFNGGSLECPMLLSVGS